MTPPSYLLPYLSIFILPFLLLLPSLTYSLASPSPSPNPYPAPAIVSLPSRPPPRALHHLQTEPQPPQVEHDLLSFVLVSTIDGAIHAVDRDNGRVRWTLKDGVEPLVGGGVRGKQDGEEYIVEPLSGGLYVFDGQDGEAEHGGLPKIRKLPLTVEQLIELSPFTFRDSPSRIFTGSKHTSLITLDLRTGQQLDCFASPSHLGNLSHLHDGDCVCADDVLDDLEGKARSNRDVLLIGRTDYRLSIHLPSSSMLGSSPSSSALANADKRAGVQEIIYSTYTPNSFDKPLAEYWAKAGSSGQLWGDEETEEKKMRVELRHDGVAVGVEQGGGVRWMTELGGVGIAVYDILLPLSPPHANPILVPQPPPHLPSLFPQPLHPERVHRDILNKPPSTYIGSVPARLSLPPSSESPSHPSDPHSASPHATYASSRSDPSREAFTRKPLLYALSSNSYPLINFAPPPKPGSMTNGSFPLAELPPEKEQLLPYLIDPPNDVATVPQGEVEMLNPDKGTKRKEPVRGWWWWVIGVLAGLGICGMLLAGRLRRPEERQAVTPPIQAKVNEKTPLLSSPIASISSKSPLARDRSVTIVEPEKSADVEHVEEVSTPRPQKDDDDDQDMMSTPKLGVPPDDGAGGKKKSTRRRVRGKKKRRNEGDLSGLGTEGEGDEEDSGEVQPRGKGEKPLPELPREMSSTNLLDEEESKERLAISDVVIGYGSQGTVVLKGTWGGRPVAVKRLLSDFTRLASQEVKLLQASDDHPNVIRYYCQERRDNFLYIALDLCQASLADLIESPDRHQEMASVLDRKKALQEVTRGLKHLHGMKIIHRDIKPQNVLASQQKDGSLRMLVSDFGLARRLEHDQSSFAPTANNLAGSLGWRAPECIRGQVRLTDLFDRSSSLSSASSSASSSDLAELADEDRGRPGARLTKAVDLFALGCLYFYVVLSGLHPFGAIYDRESNIVKGEIVNIGELDVLGEEGHEARHLIGRMLSLKAEDRPTTEECMIHPFFWTGGKRLNFLCDASDRFEIMEQEPAEPTIVALETDAPSVVGKDWYSRADKVFTSNLGKYRKYRGNSVRDLLRAMRNKKHHYQDLEPNVKRHLGALPGGFLLYFTSRWPALFLHVYGVVRDGRLRHESMFEGYFQEGS